MEEKSFCSRRTSLSKCSLVFSPRFSFTVRAFPRSNADAAPIRIRFARANPRRLSSRAEKKRILRFPKEQFFFSKYLSFPRYCATGKKEGKFFQRRLSPFHEKKKNNTRFNKYLYIREKMSILTYYMYIICISYYISSNRQSIINVQQLKYLSRLSS